MKSWILNSDFPQNVRVAQFFKCLTFQRVCVLFGTLEIHREVLHRPVSGYVPEEIWKKAGEHLNLITYTN